MQTKIYLDKEEDTVSLGRFIGERLPKPAIIYLKGDLGAGKTHLAKGIALGLGLEEDITSPTFTLINEYDMKNLHLYHLDLYRLANLNQALDLGLEDFAGEDENVVLIEWPEILGDYKLSNNLIKIEIEHNNQGRDFKLFSENQIFSPIIEGISNFADTGNR